MLKNPRKCLLSLALAAGILAAGAGVSWAVRRSRAANTLALPVGRRTALKNPVLNAVLDARRLPLPGRKEIQHLAYAARVNLESIEESLDAYMVEGLCDAASPWLTPKFGYQTVEECSRRCCRDPRMARLFRVARRGSPDERRRLREHAARIYERQLDASVRGAGCSLGWGEEFNTLVILLAESAGDGSVAVPLLVRAFRVGQVQLEEQGAGVPRPSHHLYPARGCPVDGVAGHARPLLRGRGRGSSTCRPSGRTSSMNTGSIARMSG